MPTRVDTARLTLRRFTPADVDDLAALHGDPEVMRYIDDGRPVPGEVIANRTLPELLDEYRQGPAGFGCLAAIENATGRFAGWFSLRAAHSAGLTGGTELGYRLRRDVWGRGLATEGCLALVHVAFTELDVSRLVATTMTVNHGSRRVLDKIGMRLTRTVYLEWSSYLEGAEHGDVQYELTRSRWLRERRDHR